MKNLFVRPVLAICSFLFVFLALSIITVFAQGEAPVEAKTGIDWNVIINIVFGAISALAGGFWGNAKLKLGKVAALLSLVNDAMADNQLTPEETAAIILKAKGIVGKP